ncbi:uncharacterized protein LOC110116901 [Athalia rosae]|uniref:uncharacterized protein LOC110116901 n=1 Tax=Athalia rosae TaxID=37344 RepID=UPI0020335F8A|nr:uncharacterized protein LOC110116901 [Athalia rosae]
MVKLCSVPQWTHQSVADQDLSRGDRPSEIARIEGTDEGSRGKGSGVSGASRNRRQHRVPPCGIRRKNSSAVETTGRAGFTHESPTKVTPRADERQQPGRNLVYLYTHLYVYTYYDSCQEEEEEQGGEKEEQEEQEQGGEVKSRMQFSIGRGKRWYPNATPTDTGWLPLVGLKSQHEIHRWIERWGGKPRSEKGGERQRETEGDRGRQKLGESR